MKRTGLSTIDYDAVETLIDKHGLENVLIAVAAICGGKADHLRANWQDARSAKTWDYAATVASRAARSPSVTAVSA